MPLCDCGALTARYIVHTEYPDGRKRKESVTTCPSCHPEEFPADQVFAPSLDRIVTGPEAMPDRYKRDADGVYHPTDALLQDTYDTICTEGETAKRERIKRETRRTAPLTEAEIQAAKRWGNECLKPKLQEIIRQHNGN